jgi:hypothetical protein
MGEPTGWHRSVAVLAERARLGPQRHIGSRRGVGKRRPQPACDRATGQRWVGAPAEAAVIAAGRRHGGPGGPASRSSRAVGGRWGHERVPAPSARGGWSDDPAQDSSSRAPPTVSVVGPAIARAPHQAPSSTACRASPRTRPSHGPASDTDAPRALRILRRVRPRAVPRVVSARRTAHAAMPRRTADGGAHAAGQRRPRHEPHAGTGQGPRQPPGTSSWRRARARRPFALTPRGSLPTRIIEPPLHRRVGNLASSRRLVAGGQRAGRRTERF